MHTAPRSTASWLSPDEAHAQMRRWATNRLNIRHAEPVTVLGLDGIERRYALAVIEDRPDMRDFIRRHALDGDGDAVFEWKTLMHPAAPSFAAIRCTFTAPVKKVFSLQFDLRKHMAFLQVAAETDTIAVATQLNGPHALILNPIGGDLRHMLTVFQLGEMLHGRRRCDHPS